MTPQSLLASQTGLSPYLRFGCLSVRVFYHQLSGNARVYLIQEKRIADTYPLNLMNFVRISRFI